MTITALSKADHADRDHPRWRERLQSVGFPRTDVEVRVVDDADGELPVGEVGEVVVRGDVVMAGYWNAARGHRRGAARRLAAHRRRRQLRRRRVPDAAGPVQGPDHQRRDEHLPARGRGGAAAPPRRPRRGRRRPARPGVGRGGGGLRRGRRRRRAAAGRGPRPDLPRHIARYKRPKDYRFVDALPTNNYGKVLKRELRERLRPSAETLRTGRREVPDGVSRCPSPKSPHARTGKDVAHEARSVPAELPRQGDRQGARRPHRPGRGPGLRLGLDARPDRRPGGVRPRGAAVPVRHDDRVPEGVAGHPRAASGSRA